MSKEILTGLAIFFVSFVIATCYLAYQVNHQNQEIEELRETKIIQKDCKQEYQDGFDRAYLVWEEYRKSQEEYIDRTPMGKLKIILDQVSSKEYIKDVYQCTNFSSKLMEMLERADIASEMVLGNYREVDGEEIGHAWVAIWFDAVSGKMVNVSDDYVKNIPESAEDQYSCYEEYRKKKETEYKLEDPLTQEDNL